MDFLAQNYYGNSLQAWLVAASVLILTFIGLLILRRFIASRRLRRAASEIGEYDLLLHDLIDRTKLFFLFIVAVYITSASLALPERAVSFLRMLLVISALLQSAMWGLSLIDFVMRRRLRTDRSARTTLNLISLLAKIGLWSVIILLILENITGIQVNTLIASLGIGGIAVALAVQNILGDLFASLTIALDKPFIIGDTIQVGEFTGSVEHIGLNSTRLRSNTGEQLVFANSDLLNSRMRNMTRMQRRQVIFSFNVSYDTPQEKLARIPALVEQITSQQNRVTFERAHLREMGSFALRYECAFTVESADFKTYLDAQQAIFLALIDGLRQDGIQIATITPNLP